MHQDQRLAFASFKIMQGQADVFYFLFPVVVNIGIELHVGIFANVLPVEKFFDADRFKHCCFLPILMQAFLSVIRFHEYLLF